MTGCTSNTLGMSNNVSDLLEAVANSEPEPYKVISSEDMLAATKKFNIKYMERRDDWLRIRNRKISCNICKFEEVSGAVYVVGEENEILRVRNMMKRDNDENMLADDQEIWQRLGEDCEECGPGISAREMDVCVLGNDVVALFPSIKSKNTGVIVRKRIENSQLRIEGFDYKRGARYIVMNRKYTSALHELWGVLPYRRKAEGTEPGMFGKNVNNKKETEDDMESQLVFPKREPTDLQKRMIVGRVGEIGLRIVFEHFSYKFGGQSYQQAEGGPIGARATMAAARLVMQSWGEQYLSILLEAGLLVDFLRGFVDDGRQTSTVLKDGMRFNRDEMKFEITEEGLREDKQSNEGNNARMAWLC